jgi:hypothetical protein
MQDKQIIDNSSQGAYLHSKKKEVEEEKKNENQSEDISEEEEEEDQSEKSDKEEKSDDDQSQSEDEEEDKSEEKKEQDSKKKKNDSESIKERRPKSFEYEGGTENDYFSKRLQKNYMVQSRRQRRGFRGFSLQKKGVNPRLHMFKNKINVDSLIRIKYERIRLTWNLNLQQIQRIVPYYKKMSKFQNFLESFKDIPENEKINRIRHSLVRLDFILQKLIVKGNDNRNLFSVYDEFLVYQIIIVNNEKKTGIVAKLLGSYMGRSINTVRGQTQKLHRIMNHNSHVFLYDKFVKMQLFELSQEIKLQPSLSEPLFLKERQTRVVRFSFIIDLFLLSIYKDLEFEEFVDDWDVVQLIYSALKSKRKISIKETVDWQQSMTLTDKQFVKQFSDLFENKDAYIDMLIDFEKLILDTEFMENLESDILTESSEISQEEESVKSDDGISLKSKHKNMKSISKEKESQTDSNQESNLDNSNRESLKSKPEDDPISDKESSHSRDHKEKKTHRIKKFNTVLRKRSNNGNDIFSSNLPFDQDDRELERKIRKLSSDDIRFLDWGIRQIRSRFNFNKLEIEDLDSSEKKGLVEIIQLLLNNPRTSSFAKYLVIIVQTESKSMKQLLRILNIFLRLSSNRLNIQLASRTKLTLINLIYKIETLIQFIRNTFFRRNDEEERQSIKSTFTKFKMFS